jgi:hypothetical protein
MMELDNTAFVFFVSMIKHTSPTFHFLMLESKYGYSLEEEPLIFDKAKYRCRPYRTSLNPDTISQD